MSTNRKTPSKATVAKSPVFVKVGADYSRDIELMRMRTKSEDRSPAAARARLLEAGFVFKNGVVRVNTAK